MKSENKVLVSYEESDKIYSRHIKRVVDDKEVIFRGQILKRIREVTPLDKESDTIVITAFTGKKIVYTHSETKQAYEQFEYEHICVSDDMDNCHESVINNVMDISEGGSERFMAIDTYDKNSNHKERYWYQFNDDTNQYDVCSAPLELSNIAIIETSTAPFKVERVREKEAKYGFYKI